MNKELYIGIIQVKSLQNGLLLKNHLVNEDSTAFSLENDQFIFKVEFNFFDKKSYIIVDCLSCNNIFTDDDFTFSSKLFKNLLKNFKPQFNYVLDFEPIENNKKKQIEKSVDIALFRLVEAFLKPEKYSYYNDPLCLGQRIAEKIRNSNFVFSELLYGNESKNLLHMIFTDFYLQKYNFERNKFEQHLSLFSFLDFYLKFYESKKLTENSISEEDMEKVCLDFFHISKILSHEFLFKFKKNEAK